LQPLPGGWIWDDIGNYYGAGHYGLNWNENQYDLYLKAGEKEGEETQILRTDPLLQDCILINQLTTGKKGSGDNAYIYLPPYSKTGFIKGTIPAGEKQFKISGSFPDPSLQVHHALINAFKQGGIRVNQHFNSSTLSIINKQVVPTPSTMLYTQYSPPLDSIVYWFLKKSVNLYGEALLRTLAFEKDGYGSTERGVSQVYDFWKTKGIDSNAMRMMDGSGLSPQNRITAETLVKVMQYAKARSWFAAFNDALPVYNGLKMKSGTIGGAKSFTGYAKSSTGTEYTFAIIVNNFNGPASQIVTKMYSVLNVLK
jgi:D-alanyl-D-alanine carboxypeptidase/D-alanyl-D-alanine-endopeptidase (penicillin-binding protein 4)